MGDTDSFDPRSWSGGKTPTTPPAPAAPPSPPSATAAPAAPGKSGGTDFDPRSWTRLEPDADLSNARPRAAKATGSRALPVVAAAAALALAGGGGWWWLSRDSEPQARPPASAVKAPSRPVAPPPVAGESRRTLSVESAAGVGAALVAAGIDRAKSAAIAARVQAALGGAPGEVRLEFALLGTPSKLVRLEATRADGSGIHLTTKPDGSFAEQRLTAQLKTEIRVARGEMDATSFYSAAVAAGVIDSLISDFAQAFSFDFDFQMEVAPGDIFEAAYEQKVNASGQPVGDPKLVYVSLSTPKKSKALYYFLPPGEKEAGWFDANGRSTVRSLMRTPVDGARISSKFGYRRHPILGYQKLHRGTDFAAPTGTPIYASGNATVQFAAFKGANGNLTVLRHDNGWQTLYLHQVRFADGVSAGARVAQGQIIGYVGTTGRSTGPHLHYEVHIDGQAVDPLSIDTGTGKSLAGPALKAFIAERDRIDTRRAAAG